MTLAEELDFMLESIEAETRRSSLETGFNHSSETMKELQGRLISIREMIADYRGRIVPRLLSDHAIPPARN